MLGTASGETLLLALIKWRKQDPAPTLSLERFLAINPLWWTLTWPSLKVGIDRPYTLNRRLDSITIGARHLLVRPNVLRMTQQ